MNKRVGEARINNSGCKMTIIEYLDSNNIMVEFSDKSKRKTKYSRFKDGSVTKPINRIGEININKSGHQMVVFEYVNTGNIVVKFSNGREQNTSYKSFLNRCVRYPIDHIGESSNTKSGERMEIIKVINTNHVIVKFNDKNTSVVTYGNFKKGNVKNLFTPSVCGVGYIGIGKYRIYENGTPTKAYNVWRGIMYRCYNKSAKQNAPTYIDCISSDEWHNFQVFAEWYEKNYYEVSGQKMHVDKDILYKGNKVYSKETCLIVPHCINSVFCKADSIRGDSPIGVTVFRNTKFAVGCENNLLNSRVHLGHFITKDQAFEAYRIYKEEYIKKVADEYRDQISIKLYKAMYKWKVEITD